MTFLILALWTYSRLVTVWLIPHALRVNPNVRHLDFDENHFVDDRTWIIQWRISSKIWEELIIGEVLCFKTEEINVFCIFLTLGLFFSNWIMEAYRFWGSLLVKYKKVSVEFDRLHLQLQKSKTKFQFFRQYPLQQ